MLEVPQASFVERTACINCDGRNLSELSHGAICAQPLRGFFEADPGGKEALAHFRDAEWSLLRCGDCGQAFHRYVLADEWEKRKHDEWMSQEHITAFCDGVGANTPQATFERTTGYVSHVLRIEKHTRSIRKANEPVRLLDFGCGYGDFLDMCGRFGFDAVGVDRASPRIEGASVPIFAEISDLPPGKTFHAVTLFEVIEHLHAPAEALQIAKRLLVPGGILVLECPDCAGVTDIKTHRDFRKISPLGHVNAFTNTTLRSIAERHGFRQIERGSVHVTADRYRVVKREAKHMLRQDGRSTQMYFRAV